METIVEIDRRRTETCHISVFLSLSLFLSLLLSLLYLALYLSVYPAHYQSTMSYVTVLHFFQLRSISVSVVVHLVWGVKLNTWSLCKETFLLFSTASFTLARPPLSTAIPFLLFLSFHTAETMQFQCHDATSCKLSETLWRTLSYPWIQHRKQSGWSYWGQVGVQSFFNWTHFALVNGLTAMDDWLTHLWRQRVSVLHYAVFFHFYFYSGLWLCRFKALLNKHANSGRFQSCSSFALFWFRN